MKQAVIVIHGIGEQRPMSTLRDFAEAILPTPSKPGIPKFWSKPDRMSELFELRKLTAPQTREQPPTDLYEYYWAYQAQGTKIKHVLTWIKTLFLRWPWNVPHHLQFLWWLSWSLLITGALLYFMPSVHLIGRWSANGIIGTLIAAFLAGVQGFVINYLGDAARYLDPRPENIAFRREVRAAGIQLLRRLHRSGQYNRIVVVGHSLGSVIAYDILTHTWEDFYFRHGQPLHFKQSALEAAETLGQELDSNPDLRKQFPSAQLDLWIEQQQLGNGWLVTDLITAGSPLAHADLLLARSHPELLERQLQRELPTCPPEADNKRYSFPSDYEANDPDDIKAPKQKRTIRVLHHAALFACTRWTNLYYPAKLGLLGDLVGGKLAPVFGSGIKDIAVSSRQWAGWKEHTPLIHTCYWEPIDRVGAEGLKPHSLGALIRALDLESRAWLKEAEGTAAAVAGKSA